MGQLALRAVRIIPQGIFFLFCRHIVEAVAVGNGALRQAVLGAGALAVVAMMECREVLLFFFLFRQELALMNRRWSGGETDSSHSGNFERLHHGRG